MAAHFNREGHHLLHAKFVGLEKVRKSWLTYRRVREQYSFQCIKGNSARDG